MRSPKARPRPVSFSLCLCLCLCLYLSLSLSLSLSLPLATAATGAPDAAFDAPAVLARCAIIYDYRHIIQTYYDYRHIIYDYRHIMRAYYKIASRSDRQHVVRQPPWHTIQQCRQITGTWHNHRPLAHIQSYQQIIDTCTIS